MSPYWPALSEFPVSLAPALFCPLALARLSEFPPPESKTRLFQVFVVPAEEGLDEWDRPLVLSDEELTARRAMDKEHRQGQDDKARATGFGTFSLYNLCMEGKGVRR
jgi:hypothetical protein